MSTREEEKDELELGGSLSLFIQNEESYEEAQARSDAESSYSGVDIKRFKSPKNGDVTVRILPLKPRENMNRRGYEYPVSHMFLNIKVLDEKGNIKKDKKGQPVKDVCVKVVDARYCFPELKKEKIDIIDTYRRVAVAKLKESGNEALAKKVDGGSFDGGLKYDYKRVMYLYDLDNKKDGIQVWEASYSQFKDIEARKMKNWQDILSYDKEAKCPLSSPTGAYQLTITGKTEAKKVSYSFSLSDSERKKCPLTKKEADELMALPALDEYLYVYNRYHFGATIAFLKQFDKENAILAFDSEEVQNAIAKVEAQLPSDDTREFTLERKSDEAKDDDDDDDEVVMDIDQLLDAYDDFVESGEGEKSESGLALRAAMKAFIAEEGLAVRARKSMTNAEIIREIQVELGIPVDDAKDDDEDDDDDDRDGEPSIPVSSKKVAEDEPEVRTPRTARGARPGRHA